MPSKRETTESTSAKKKALRVCMIVYAYYPYDTRVQREAETLVSQSNYKVTVLSLKGEGSVGRYQKNGVNVRELNISKYRGKSNKRYIISYLKFMFLALFSCTRLSFNRSIDVVHIHNMPNFLVLSAVFPRLFGKKIVLDIHDTMIETYSAKFERGFVKSLLRILYWEESFCCALAHKIICVNQVQKATLVARGLKEEKITIFMNVPDPYRLNHEGSNRGERKDNKKFSLVYHGTVAKRLGIDLTIKAVALLVKKIPGLTFHVIGSGDDLDDFIELTKRLQVEKNVKFSKAAPLEELVYLLVKMDLGVISNRRNVATELMLPVKMLEYAALDIPVVAPRLKAIQYYFSDNMVGYFEPDNVDSLADAIFDLYNDKSKREKQAREAKGFTEKYNWARYQKNLTDLYDKL